MLPFSQCLSSTCPNSRTAFSFFLFFPKLKKGFFSLLASLLLKSTQSPSPNALYVFTLHVPFGTQLPLSLAHSLLFPDTPTPRTHQSRAPFSALLPRVPSRSITVLDALLDTCSSSTCQPLSLSLSLVPRDPLYQPPLSPPPFPRRSCSCSSSSPTPTAIIRMERRGGGCCIVRYGAEPDVAWKMDRIMLRFRPIAPKPTVDGGAAAAPTVAPPKTGRKRRANPASTSIAGKDGGGRGRKVIKKEDNFNLNLKTLALMPEMPERKEEVEKKKMVTTYVPAVWTGGMGMGVGMGTTGEVVVPRPLRPAGSWVTVECVTDTWKEVSGWGCEEEARRRAVMDTCPVFLSGALDRVTWTNEAYRRMVVGEEEEEEEAEEVRVALVTRGMVPQESVAFTCRVRVRYACRKGKGSLAAPCDVWRLGDGGLAWRLDVKAALSLRLGR